MTPDAASGALYVVSTPIGNLGDMSYRAVEVLSSAALVVAEDTRHSRRLLDHYEIRARVAAYHEHNEARETPKLIARLQDGESIALITDAGTPLLSDPGERLVRAAIEAGVPVVPVPGASALLAALVGSGLAGERFTFFGFLPRKGRERFRAVTEIMRLRHTAVIYESPVRTGETLAEFAEAGAAARTAVVARELTKKFEEFARGTVGDLAERFRSEPPRGEVVILIGGAGAELSDESSLRDRAQELAGQGVTARDVVDELVARYGARRNVAYRIAHDTSAHATGADEMEKQRIRPTLAGTERGEHTE